MTRHMREVVIVAGLPSRTSSIFIDGEFVERVTRIEVQAGGDALDQACRVVVEFEPGRIAFVGPACVEQRPDLRTEALPGLDRLRQIADACGVTPFTLSCYPARVISALDAVTVEATA